MATETASKEPRRLPGRPPKTGSRALETTLRKNKVDNRTRTGRHLRKIGHAYTQNALEATRTNLAGRVTRQELILQNHELCMLTRDPAEWLASLKWYVALSRSWLRGSVDLIDLERQLDKPERESSSCDRCGLVFRSGPDQFDQYKAHRTICLTTPSQPSPTPSAESEVITDADAPGSAALPIAPPAAQSHPDPAALTAGPGASPATEGETD